MRRLEIHFLQLVWSLEKLFSDSKGPEVKHLELF
jgi:hypothetical protein